VIGNVVNNGTVVVGGPGNIGKLRIDGLFTQNNSGSVVVDVFNNGFATRSDLLTVTGKTLLNGGELIIGFTTNSLGLVTADFKPFDFQGGVSGNFAAIRDAGGNILAVSFANGIFTVLGSTPEVPDTVVDDLVSFLDDSEELDETVASNSSEADAIVEELKKDESEEGSLVCN
jgi:homogentisate 1,2-dioxygenase